ncbi:hypothetical protein EYC59_00420 [Candidatus Saccharibacteria bacterium]|nr:MAG: hypothetical protein EYC59_00420 [Candidatus Saccharibacteria bacterium]
MNKKKLVLLAILVVILVTGLLVFRQYKISFQKVTININNSSSTVRVGLYERKDIEGEPQKTGEELQTITSGETFKLKKGMYVLVPKGEQLDPTPIRLTVQATPVNLTLDIPYTQEYLQQLLTSESAAIQTAITAKYPTLTKDYTLNPGLLYHRGEWYGTTIDNKIGPENNRFGDTLRLVLQKKDGQWVVLSTPPEILLSAPNYPQVPVDFLRIINQL